MDLTVIILNFNTLELLKKCLESIFENKWKYKIQVVVVDNNSTDGSSDMVKKNFPKVKILQNKKNFGFSKGNNVGLKSAQSRYCLLLNSDTMINNMALDNLIDFMDRSNFGIGSCYLLNQNNTFQPNAGDLPLFLPIFVWLSGLDDILFFLRGYLPSFHRKYISYYQGEKEVGWVSGSAMIIKKEVLDKIGFLDEKIFMYCEDVEYCMRAKSAGFKIGWTDKARIIHLGGGSLKNQFFSQRLGEFKGLLYLYKKYYGILAAILIKGLIYFFVLIRILAFLTAGRIKLSKTYAKIFIYL